MSAQGSTYTATFTTALPRDQVIQSFLAALAGVPECNVTMAGDNTIVVTRRYTPSWAIAVGIIGFFLFLIGIVALFIKTTETLTVTLFPSDSGTRAVVSGVASEATVSQLGAIGASLTAGNRVAADGGWLSPDGLYRWDGSTWVSVSGSDVAGAAKSSAAQLIAPPERNVAPARPVRIGKWIGLFAAIPVASFVLVAGIVVWNEHREDAAARERFAAAAKQGEELEARQAEERRAADVAKAEAARQEAMERETAYAQQQRQTHEQQGPHPPMGSPAPAPIQTNWNTGVVYPRERLARDVAAQQLAQIQQSAPVEPPPPADPEPPAAIPHWQATGPDISAVTATIYDLAGNVVAQMQYGAGTLKAAPPKSELKYKGRVFDLGPEWQERGEIVYRERATPR